MKFSTRKSNRMLKVLSQVLYDLPTPVNLTCMWNFGSMMGLLLVSQILTGLLMAMHYTPHVEHAFASVIHIMRDVNWGWMLRSFHANGASFLFLCVYAHIGRGIFYHSFYMTRTWTVGCIILILMMAIAFTGYVLPWGQMSFWGATVITNLFSAVPYVGSTLVKWLWGGFCVSDATLKRFFVFHFLAPFILLIFMCMHVTFLHDTGSGNPLGLESDVEAIPFHSYYFLKDLVGLVVLKGALFIVCLMCPSLFMDPVNFISADPMSTPVHIQPEWYFLFAYCILRSIPNKLGGVIALLMSVGILFFLPLYPKSLLRGIQYNPVAEVLFFMFVGNFFVLTFIGSCPIEPPFVMVGAVSSGFYFLFFVLYPMTWFFWDSVIYKDMEQMKTYTSKEEQEQYFN